MHGGNRQTWQKREGTQYTSRSSLGLLKPARKPVLLDLASMPPDAGYNKTNIITQQYIFFHLLLTGLVKRRLMWGSHLSSGCHEKHTSSTTIVLAFWSDIWECNSENVWYQFGAVELLHFNIGKCGIQKICHIATCNLAGTVFVKLHDSQVHAHELYIRCLPKQTCKDSTSLAVVLCWKCRLI
jgi:hypothetical protein